MKTIVGIDEVGRGPLAGPVTVCAVSCNAGFYAELKRNKTLPRKGIDCKKLSSQERKNYAKILKSFSATGAFSYSISHVSNKIIDGKGISFAVSRAIERCLRKLDLNPGSCSVLLDGSLKAPKEFKDQKTIIKGDEKEKIISWASILAKVRRDNLMTRLSKKFPGYGFEVHKGYGTSMHYRAIRKNGASIAHRLTWLKIEQS